MKLNGSNLEGNLWAVEHEMLALEKQLVAFLSTRRTVFSKFGLCSDKKLKHIFSHKVTDWASFIFPQVGSLVVDRSGH